MFLFTEYYRGLEELRGQIDRGDEYDLDPKHFYRGLNILNGAEIIEAIHAAEGVDRVSLLVFDAPGEEPQEVVVFLVDENYAVFLEKNHDSDESEVVGGSND